MTSQIIIADLDFSFLEMNPFTLVNGEPYPLDMRGELDDTAAFKNFKKYIPCFNKSLLQLLFNCLILLVNLIKTCVATRRWGNIEFPLPFGRVLSPTESFIHGLDEKVAPTLLH